MTDLHLYVKDSLLPFVLLAILQVPNVPSAFAKESLLRYHVCILKLRNYENPRVLESSKYVNDALLYYEKKAMESPTPSLIYKCLCLSLDLCEFYFLMGNYKNASQFIHQSVIWVQDSKQLLNVSNFAHKERDRLRCLMTVLIPFMPTESVNQCFSIQSDWFMTVFTSIRDSVFDSPTLLSLFQRDVCKEPQIPFKIKEYVYFRAASCKQMKSAIYLSLFASLSHSTIKEMKKSTNSYMISWIQLDLEHFYSFLNEFFTSNDLELSDKEYKKSHEYLTFVCFQIGVNLNVNRMISIGFTPIFLLKEFINEQFDLKFKEFKGLQALQVEESNTNLEKHFKNSLFESFTHENHTLDYIQFIKSLDFSSNPFLLESIKDRIKKQCQFLLQTQQYELGSKLSGIVREELELELMQIHYDCLLKEDFQFIERYIMELVSF